MFERDTKTTFSGVQKMLNETMYIVITVEQGKQIEMPSYEGPYFTREEAENRASELRKFNENYKLWSKVKVANMCPA